MGSLHAGLWPRLAVLAGILFVVFLLRRRR